MADTTETATTQTADGSTTGTETQASTTQTDATQTGAGTTTTTETKSGEGTTETTDQGKTDAKANEQTKTDAQPNVPEAYEFKAPEGTTLDPAGVEVFTPLFKEAKLDNATAQKFLDTYATYQGQLLAKQAETWLETAKADKEIGGDKFDGTAKMAQAAFAKWASPELKTFLESTGLGNHPELLRTFAKIGAAGQEESTFVQGRGSAGESDPAKVLFPNQQ